MDKEGGGSHETKETGIRSIRGDGGFPSQDRRKIREDCSYAQRFVKTLKDTKRYLYTLRQR